MKERKSICYPLKKIDIKVKKKIVYITNLLLKCGEINIEQERKKSIRSDILAYPSSLLEYINVYIKACPRHSGTTGKKHCSMARGIITSQKPIRSLVWNDCSFYAGRYVCARFSRLFLLLDIYCYMFLLNIFARGRNLRECSIVREKRAKWWSDYARLDVRNVWRICLKWIGKSEGKSSNEFWSDPMTIFTFYIFEKKYVCQQKCWQNFTISRMIWKYLPNSKMFANKFIQSREWNIYNTNKSKMKIVWVYSNWSNKMSSKLFVKILLDDHTFVKDSIQSPPPSRWKIAELATFTKL